MLTLPPPVLPLAPTPFHVEQFEGSSSELIHTRLCFLNPLLLVNLALKITVIGDLASCSQAWAGVVGTVVSDGLQPRIGAKPVTLPCARRPTGLLGCEKSLTACG